MFVRRLPNDSHRSMFQGKIQSAEYLCRLGKLEEDAGRATVDEEGARTYVNSFRQQDRKIV